MASPREPRFVSQVMPDDFTFRDMRDRSRDDMPITTFPEPDFPGIRPPRRPEQPRRNSGGFDNDYSFLNLPRAGSGVRGPIDLPDMSPVDSNFQIDSYAPTDLPDVEMLAPTPQPLSVDESFSVLDSVRPFEDSASLGANQEERFAELGRFFGEKVNSLKSNIDELTAAKDQIGSELQVAVAEQDTIRQTSAEQQLTALEQQEQALRAELETAVAEAEAQGIDAVAAAEAAAAEKYGTEITSLENTIGNLQTEIDTITGARDTAVTERDEAIANQDVIRAEAADAQVQALDGQKTTLETQYNQTIGDLQGQIDALNTSQVVAETPVTAELPVVEETTQPDFYNPNYMGGEDEKAIAQYYAKSSVGGLPEDIAVNESVADLGFDPTVAVATAPANDSYVPITGQDLGLNVDQNLQQAAIDAQLELDLAQAQGPATQGQFEAAKNAATAANAQKAFVESGGKTLEQERAELARQNAIAASAAARPPVGTVDMSKINLPNNYMDAIKNIQPPQNFNFNNLRVGMNQGGEMNRIQLLLNRLR